jgi:hypothetical protein
MAINKNHECEEINGVKCSIVEKNVSASRAEFLKELLSANQYLVETGPSAPPKATAETPAEPVSPTFTIGVTDLTFNSINAVFGRLLKTRDGHVVTLAYWQQQELQSRDDIPYFDR